MTPFVVVYPHEIEHLRPAIVVADKTAYRWWKAGKLDAYQMDTGTVIVRDPLTVSATNVALYARVSSVDQKNDLERQLEGPAHGAYEFFSRVDIELRELEQEAQRKGFVLDSNWDGQHLVYTIELMSREDHAAFLAEEEEKWYWFSEWLDRRSMASTSCSFRKNPFLAHL